jgi:hypothetical protein
LSAAGMFDWASPRGVRAVEQMHPAPRPSWTTPHGPSLPERRATLFRQRCAPRRGLRSSIIAHRSRLDLTSQQHRQRSAQPLNASHGSTRHNRTLFAGLRAHAADSGSKDRDNQRGGAGPQMPRGHSIHIEPPMSRNDSSVPPATARAAPRQCSARSSAINVRVRPHRNRSFISKPRKSRRFGVHSH